MIGVIKNYEIFALDFHETGFSSDENDFKVYQNTGKI